MDKPELVKLCSRTWALTVLRLMAEGVPGRTSPLAAAAGCGRTAMQASVLHLVELGVLEKNPGYGHPLRADYRLTASGAQLAEWSATLHRIVSPEADPILWRGKWSLPLISCLPVETRYGELRRQLNPVTDRALSMCLNQLGQRRLIARRVSTRVAPPAVSYRLLAAGDRVYGHLQTLLTTRG
jgi:DNA-binding HxlR family transcriptional regulator